jgi:gliding motility-associated-like protein
MSDIASICAADARPRTGWRVACGIGVSWVVGLACILFNHNALGQITSVTWEVDTTFYEPAPLPGSLPGTPQYNFDSNGALTGYTTYKFYANFTSATDRLSSVYALSTGPNMQFNAPCGCYNTPTYGQLFGGLINPVFYTLVPELRYDSYITIDNTNGESLATTNPPNGTITNGTGFCGVNIIDGAYFVTGGVQAGADLKILVAQITTCGPITFQACFQVFVGGNQANIQFYCMQGQGSGPINITPPCANWAANTTPVSVVQNIDCFGDLAVVDVEAVGSLGPITYELFDANTNALIATQVGNNTFGNLVEGDYYVAMVDGNTCRDTTDVFGFVEPPAFEVSFDFVQDNLCAGELINVVDADASGGTPPYSFVAFSLTNTGNGVLADADGTWEGLPCVNGNGGWEFIVEDDNGCQVDQIYQLNCPAPLVLNLEETDLTCAGAGNGAITGTITGGTGALTLTSVPAISNIAGPSPLLVQATGLDPGTYALTVEDANGCTTSGDYTLLEPVSMTVEVTTTDLLCADQCNGTVVQVASGGTAPFTYLVTTTGGAGADADALCVGDYIANAIDANNCVVQTPIEILAPAPITFEVEVSNVSCAGEADGSICVVDAAGGNGSLAYQVTPGGTFGPDSCFDLAVGTYTVSVRDENDCVVTESNLTLTEPQFIDLILNTSPISCQGFSDGAVSVSAIGGTGEIVLVGPVAADLPFTLEDLGAGQVVIEVEDENGCLASEQITLNDPPLLELEVLFTQDVICGGDCNGTAVIDYSGGTGATTLTLNGGTGFNLQALCADTYDALVTDANGCETSASFVISEPEPIEVLMAVNNVTCTGMNDGAANIFPIGGTGGVTWELLTPGIDLDNLFEGVYEVVAVDGIGCSVDTFFVVSAEEVTDMVIEMLASPVSCWNQVDGTATASVTGGYFPISYVWSDALAQTTATATGLAEDTYVVVVTDSLGCTLSETVVVEPTVGCFFIADALTPNGDGYNDEWVVGGLEFFPDAQVSVFNRYGQLLFNSVGYQEPWNGRYNNAPLPVADYYYVIEFSNGNEPITGTVTIKY